MNRFALQWLLPDQCERLTHVILLDRERPAPYVLAVGHGVDNANALLNLWGTRNKKDAVSDAIDYVTVEYTRRTGKPPGELIRQTGGVRIVPVVFVHGSVADHRTWDAQPTTLDGPADPDTGTDVPRFITMCPEAGYASDRAGRSGSRRLRSRTFDVDPIRFEVSIHRALTFLVRGVLVAGAVAFAVDPQAVLAQEATQSREARARSFIDFMAGGQYAQAFELFTPQMKAAMPMDRLSATWNSLTAQAGPFQRQVATSVTPRGVLTVVVVTCAFERATFDVHVTVNPANLVGGLAIRPAMHAVTYAPPPYANPDAYKESEVTVGTGQWALPGTLTMPVGSSPVPAVVLVHGSGPGDRDATVGQIKQFKDLALGLASRGIAVLRYDKRTRAHGNLMRDLPGLTVKEETIDDAIAAVQLLRSTPGVDPNRIVVLGHSLGGMLVPRIAAAEPPVAGFVVMAGAARPITQAVVEQARYLAQVDGAISPEEQAQISEFEQVRARVDALGPKDASSPERIFGATASYWLDLRGYDPPAAAVRVKQPMLVLQGERDYQVTMEEFSRWKSALSERTDVVFHSYPTLNHLFVAGTGKSVPAEYLTPGHISEAVVRDIATWITALPPRRQ